MAKLITSNKREISEGKLLTAYSVSITSITILNQAMLPGNPVGYVSQYQLDIIEMALGKEMDKPFPIAPPANFHVEKRSKYPASAEFAATIEASRAGIHCLMQNGVQL